MIHLHTAELKSFAKPLHMLIAAQQEMHWKTDTHMHKYRRTKTAACRVWNVLWT